MAIQKPTLPKGTRDFGPADVQKRKYILNTIETVFKKYGFMPLETPTMENLTTLEGKYGDEGDKLLFRILDSGDFLKSLKEYNDKMLSDESQDVTFLPSYTGKLNDLDAKATTKFIAEKGLRYDLTVPFARYVVMNRNEITFPFKRYQMQPVWRADRPQKGRYREFWQCDADVVGSDSLLNELDLIQIYAEAFTKLGINNYEIKINNRKVLAGIAQVVKSIDVMNTIAVAIDKLDKIGIDGVSNELTEQGFSQTELNTLFDIITIKGENQTILNQLKDKLQASEEGLKGIEELAFILASNPNQNINLTLDFSLARGLSYYTGCIFEVVSNDGTLKSSIGGGGRYDNLTGIFGLPNVSGVGISFGLDRIYDVMDELKLFPEQLRATSTQVLFCHFDEASQQYCLPAAKALRDAGIATEIYPDVVKKKAIAKQLDYANALQIPFAAIAGETEVEQGIFNFKNLVTGEQKAVTLTELIGTFVSA
jgi:histidyl-tRNA synthetase